MLDRPESDPLAAVVALLRPQTVLSKVVRGAGRWGVRYAAQGQPSFCLMLAGSCWLSVAGAKAQRLDPGDFVLLPGTPEFRLASDPGQIAQAKAMMADTRARERRYGDASGEVTMQMLGGFFLFDPANAPLLLGLLPSVVHVRAIDGGALRLAWMARAIGDEATADRPGREPILVRLVEILLIEALRWRPADASPQVTGLLAGLADARLGKALRRLHGDVAHRWTVEDLARAAGMSRAAFAAAFTRTMGMPPMDYLLRWRMVLAKDLLRRGDVSLTDIAATIGYQSASAFSTAFSRCVGQAPGAFARRIRAAV